MGAVDAFDWSCVLCGRSLQNNWASRATDLHWILLYAWTFIHETIRMIQKAAAMGNWWLAASSRQCTLSCIMSHAEFFCKTSNYPVDSAPLQPSLLPCNFCFFPKLKSPLKGKRVQIVNEIQENTTGQLMAFGRIVWGSKVLTSYVVPCILYLL